MGCTNMHDNYYWQNDKVRLRLWLPKDAEYSSLLELDSDGMSLVQEEITLPQERHTVDDENIASTGLLKKLGYLKICK